MIAIKGMEMPKNCAECNRIGLQQIIDCQLIYSGCANCGRHPDCPLVEIVTCKDCKYNNNGLCPDFRPHVSDNFYCADAKRRE